MSLENWWAKAKMHSVGRWPRFSCMAVKAGTISSMSVISSSHRSPGIGVLVGDGTCRQLPQQRRAVVGVAGEQLVQQRGARAPEAGHDDGRGHRLAQRRPAPASRGRPCAGGSGGSSWSSPRVRRRPGRWRWASSSSEAQQAAERLLPPVVAEVVEPGRRDGGGPEVVGPERDDGAPVVTEAATERDHLVDPRAARRWGPGHGPSPYPQRGRMTR